MKHLRILALLFCVIAAPKIPAQKIEKIDSEPLSSVLPFIKGIKTFSNNEMGVTVLLVRHPNDLMPTPENPGHELYDRLYICISESGELASFKMYRILKLYNIKNLTMTENGKFDALLKFSASGQEFRYDLDVRDFSVKKLNR